MGTRIIWKRRAWLKVRETVHYLKEEFGQKTVDKFLDTLAAREDQLRADPLAGIEMPAKPMRRLRIDRINSLFYKYKPKTDTVVIYLLWNNRQDPRRNPYA